MIDIKPIEEKDADDLIQAINQDTFHPGEWKVTDFYDGTGFCETVRDENGPIVFVKFTKSLRISVVWADSENHHRNAQAIVLGIKDAVEKARGQGYTEIIIQTNVPKLANFLTRVIGMRKSGDEFLLPLGNQ